MFLSVHCLSMFFKSYTVYIPTHISTFIHEMFQIYHGCYFPTNLHISIHLIYNHPILAISHGWVGGSPRCSGHSRIMSQFLSTD